MALKKLAIWVQGSILWCIKDKFQTSAGKRILGNISLRLDPLKIRIYLWLSITVSSRFSKHMYIDNYTKTWSLTCNYRSLWNRLQYKLKVAIFLRFFKGPKVIFGPKHVFLPILRLKTSHWIRLISAIDCFYK